ncbi:MAG: hypothetical protein C0623_00705 [Desulfuromonas sp.]|nr:MAG: hypothetical protein C0623_00705 [Desulfuromonas sp.]
MEIVFFRHSLLSRGGDKMVLSHAGYLADQGHSVTILTTVVETVFPIDDRIVVRLTGRAGKLGTLWSGFATRFRADVIVADIIPLAFLLFFRNRERVIYFSQDYDESYYFTMVQRLFIRSLYTLGLTYFRIPVIAVSHYLADLLRNRFHAKVIVVTNGVDTKVFYPEHDPDLALLKNDKKAIVSLSRSDARKGFDVAQKVLQKVGSECIDDFVVWTVGESCESAFPGLHHRHFGYVKEDELRRIFSSADLFLYPSRHEGFPLMALEALACGCPLVTTDAVNVVKNDVEALVSPVEDVGSLAEDVKKVLADERLSDRLSRAGFDFVEKNTLAQSRANFCLALDGIFKGRPCR